MSAHSRMIIIRPLSNGKNQLRELRRFDFHAGERGLECVLYLFQLLLLLLLLLCPNVKRNTENEMLWPGQIVEYGTKVSWGPGCCVKAGRTDLSSHPGFDDSRS